MCWSLRGSDALLLPGVFMYCEALRRLADSLTAQRLLSERRAILQSLKIPAEECLDAVLRLRERSRLIAARGDAGLVSLAQAPVLLRRDFPQSDDLVPIVVNPFAGVFM